MNADLNHLTHSLAEAIAAHAPLPAFDLAFGLDEAYALQHQVAALRSPGNTGGIKIGVTTPAAQTHFGLNHALLGTLYADARIDSGAELEYLEGRSLESEFAVIVDANGKPKAIAPAIEIVYVNFSRPADMTAANLTASNLGADLFLVGEFLPWSSPHDQASVTLRRDGEIVNEASMNDALGGPAAAVGWLTDEVGRRGFELTGETLVMMGACGSVVPARKGVYRADYGPMGSLSFSIT